MTVPVGAFDPNHCRLHHPHGGFAQPPELCSIRCRVLMVRGLSGDRRESLLGELIDEYGEHRLLKGARPVRVIGRARCRSRRDQGEVESSKSSDSVMLIVVRSWRSS